jgi:hypothetical protein
MDNGFAGYNWQIRVGLKRYACLLDITSHFINCQNALDVKVNNFLFILLGFVLGQCS